MGLIEIYVCLLWLSAIGSHFSKNLNLSIPATLQKSAGAYHVGGIASSFHRDLDGDAIVPGAVEDAIPDFMASRGGDGIKGGPIRLHHDFWQKFLQRAIALLNLPQSKQFELIAAISLPLGRVTRMWMDAEGRTHWEGILSAANPIAQIIWDMLKEGLIHLGVSLGGKILQTQSNGRDSLGRLCTLITEIRLDELSITDNPALRLTQDEDTGAYITALAKSIKSAMTTKESRFLRKAIGGNAQTEIAVNAVEVKTGIGRSFGEPKSLAPRNKTSNSTASSNVKTGLGGKSKAPAKPMGSGVIPGVEKPQITVEAFVKDLKKACKTGDRAKMQSPEMLRKFGDGAYGLASLTDNPPPMLVNMVRFLQMCNQFAQQLPHMDDFQAQGTVDAMSLDLNKALEDFQEGMPTALMQKTFRPPGSPGFATPMITFPQQYI